jgi:hypothetical protein
VIKSLSKRFGTDLSCGFCLVVAFIMIIKSSEKGFDWYLICYQIRFKEIRDLV